jgi:hypothetical protein
VREYAGQATDVIEPDGRASSKNEGKTKTKAATFHTFLLF